MRSAPREGSTPGPCKRAVALVSVEFISTIQRVQCSGAKLTGIRREAPTLSPSGCATLSLEEGSMRWYNERTSRWYRKTEWRRESAEPYVSNRKTVSALTSARMCRMLTLFGRRKQGRRTVGYIDAGSRQRGYVPGSLPFAPRSWARGSGSVNQFCADHAAAR